MSGEKQDIRTAVDRYTGRLVESGIPPAEARRLAGECAERADRRDNGEPVKARRPFRDRN